MDLGSYKRRRSEGRSIIKRCSPISSSYRWLAVPPQLLALHSWYPTAPMTVERLSSFPLFTLYPYLLQRADRTLFQYTATAVNCEDALPATYCGTGAAKHFYLADTTYLPAAKGGDAKTRIIQCYSGADIVTHFLF